MRIIIKWLRSEAVSDPVKQWEQEILWLDLDQSWERWVYGNLINKGFYIQSMSKRMFTISAQTHFGISLNFWAFLFESFSNEIP